MCETPGKMHVHDIGNIAGQVFENVGGGGGGGGGGMSGVSDISDRIVKIYISTIFFLILLPYIMNII